MSPSRAEVQPPPQRSPLGKSFPGSRRGPGRGCGGTGREQLSPLLAVHFTLLEEQEARPASWCCTRDRVRAHCPEGPAGDAACPLLMEIRNRVQTLPLFSSEEKAAFSLENKIKTGSCLISKPPEVGLATQASRATAL